MSMELGTRSVGACSTKSAGGAEEDRTPDLVIANDALSQLSYSPVPADGRHLWVEPLLCQAMFDPADHALAGMLNQRVRMR
jgi:hypothetical protein